MENVGYYNGEVDLIENIKVPMDDRVHYFGDGVYDATCACNGVIYALDAHIDRFYNSARLVDIEISYTKEELKDILNGLVAKAEGNEHFVYWQVTRGTAPRKHAYPKGTKSNLWVTVRQQKIADIYQKVGMITLEDTRFFHCNIKTLNLLPNVIAAEKADKAGCEEAVFHRNGRVTEGAHSNIHILKDGVFITAPLDNLILPGTARRHIIDACKEQGIPVEERPYTLDELKDADEIMLSSASRFCIATDKIDGVSAGGKDPENLKKIQDKVLEYFCEATGFHGYKK